MQRKKKTIEEERNDPIKKMEEQRLQRKREQDGFSKNYQTANKVIKDEIDENEGTDIIEGMLKDRREWVNMTKEMNNGKIPDDIKPFYERNNVETPLSPEEEEAKAAGEEDGGKKGKKKKEEKKKKGKKGKKAKGGDGDGSGDIVKIGTSEIV